MHFVNPVTLFRWTPHIKVVVMGEEHGVLIEKIINTCFFTILFVPCEPIANKN